MAELVFFVSLFYSKIVKIHSLDNADLHRERDMITTVARKCANVISRKTCWDFSKSRLTRI
jgi:hypothetical protein